MNHTRLKILPPAVLASTPAFPQRAPSAAYDSAKTIKLAGPVTKIDWVNPKAFFLMNVRDATGTIATWAVEFGNPLDLERDGWKRDSLHIGDVVTVEGSPSRDPG